MTLQDRLRRIARRRAQRSVGRRRGGSAARGSSSPSEASRWRGEAARHLLYERAMDDDGAEMELFAGFYRALRAGRDARRVREDFCGSCFHCCHWVARDARNSAVGVDNDPKVLAFARDAFGGSRFALLTDAEQARVRLVAADVARAALSLIHISEPTRPY